MKSLNEKTKAGLGNRILNGIETAGNKLPDPVSLFIILACIVVAVSGICGVAGVSAIHPGTGDTIQVMNLFSRDGLRIMWTTFINNFVTFGSFGMVW